MSVLNKFWSAWKRFGHFMGDLVGRVVLSIFYFTIMLPFSFIVTLFSDPLDMRHKHKAPAWQARTTGDRTLEEARRQF